MKISDQIYQISKLELITVTFCPIFTPQKTKDNDKVSLSTLTYRNLTQYNDLNLTQQTNI